MSLTLINQIKSDSYSQSWAENEQATGTDAEQLAGTSFPAAYFDGAIARCGLEKTEDGVWFAEIPGFDGLWAQGATRAEATEELRNALAGWLVLKIKDGDGDIPVIDHINLNTNL